MGKRKIAVFIASPNDLASERRSFRNTIEELNKGFGDGASVEFEALGWEDTLATTGRRSQSVINREIDRCDVFILTLNRRWGQDAPDSPFSSYTEEEFHRAFERWKREKKPEIFVFFKRVDPASEADAGPQLKKVMKFRKQLEKSRKVLYHYFEDEKTFVKEVDRHLRFFAKDELPKADEERGPVILPLSALEEIDKSTKIAEKKIKKAKDAEEETLLKLEAKNLEIAKDAAKLSKEGMVEYARQKFSQLVVESSNLQILFLGYEFFMRTGDLEATETVLEKWLSISGPEKKTASTASAFGNLGIVYKKRGELEQAEEMHKRSLEINESLNRKEGMASNYGNLGNVYQTHGDLDKAEQMYRKSLEIEESLGRKEGMASNYGNLGNVYDTRGELDKAEQMYRKSLEIEESLGRKEGMASDYCNLGIVYKTRGELDKAEAMYEKALEINESLGSKEGMAINYGNLGSVYKAHGDLEKTEMMYEKSIELFGQLGSPNAEVVAGWLQELKDEREGED